MTCYNPIHACYSKSEYAKSGKKHIHLVLNEDTKDKYLLNERDYPHALYHYLYIPCGKCVGCRSDNAKMWSLRAQNELKMHKFNCFITLTYNNESPTFQKDPLCIASLRYKHFQNFMKRLRKRFPNDKISYLVCGEYGPKDGRAHWHAILFGFDFPDKELVYVSKGYNHYSSQILEECWSDYDKETKSYFSIGFVDLADVDEDCCNYVSQYVLKKLPIEQDHIIVDYTDDGEPIKLEGRVPPMIKSSRNPAIGLRWFEKYGRNSVEKGYIDVPNKERTGRRKVKTPAYYYSKFEQVDPIIAAKFKKCKEEKMREYYKKHPVDRDKLLRWQESHLYRINKAIKKALTKFVK